MIARIQSLLLDAILAANTLPRHFEFAQTRIAQAAVSMLDLHWADASGAARHELWDVVRRCHYSDGASVSEGLAGVDKTGI